MGEREKGINGRKAKRTKEKRGIGGREKEARKL
jgi:hypothetical protein